jgi:hypothetical protein
MGLPPSTPALVMRNDIFETTGVDVMWYYSNLDCTNMIIERRFTRGILV